MEDNNERVNEGSTNRTFLWLGVGFLLVVVLLGGYYFMTKSNSTVVNTQTDNTQVQAPTATQTEVTASETKKFTVEGSEFAFSPQTIEVNKGDTVELSFKNTGAYPHDLVVGDLGVRTKIIKQGEMDTVSFLADKAGTYEFLCSVPGHSDKGMVGSLTVK
jgi:uncharacterized cupredoxin-like copper-binding protein